MPTKDKKDVDQYGNESVIPTEDELYTKETKQIRKWALNPELFVQQCIIDPYNKVKGTEIKISAQQKEGFRAIKALVWAKIWTWPANYKRYKNKITPEVRALANKIGISIMSGKGTGKDAFASWCIIWFMTCFPYPKVPCTSVTSDQLGVVLWSELSKWLTSSLVADWFSIQKKSLYFKFLPEKEKGKRWMAFPRTANPKSSVEEQVETLAGLHEDYMMIVVDEGSGIPDPVFDPLEGTLTSICNFVLCIFNPTRAVGYAVETQTKNSEYWITLIWNAEESHISDKRNIERIKKKYAYDVGIDVMDSNPCRIRIFGLPPKNDEEALIPWEWIENAAMRDIEPGEKDPIVSALDCGAGGDKSVFGARKGGKVYPFKKAITPDSRDLMGWGSTQIDNIKPDVCRIDLIGIGWNIYGEMREKKGSIIESFDSRKRANNPERFYNKRAEAHWRLREQFEQDIIDIPNDDDLKSQLGVIRKKVVGKGLIAIIEKAIIKKELGHSPDESDTLAMMYSKSDSLVTKKGTERGKYIHQIRDMRPKTRYSWMRK